MAILAIISAFCGWLAVSIIAGSLIGRAVSRMADDCDDTDYEGFL